MKCIYYEDCDDAGEDVDSCNDFNPIEPLDSPPEELEEDISDEEEDSDDLDYGDDLPIGCDFDDDGPELSSEEAALSRDYINSDMAKVLKTAIMEGNLSSGCKKAFLHIVGLYYSKDMFLAYLTRPDTVKLNLKLALMHVHLSAIPHDVEQPLFLQLQNNITETFPIVASHAVGGRERYLQGLRRSETRSGEIEKFAPHSPPAEQTPKKRFSLRR